MISSLNSLEHKYSRLLFSHSSHGTVLRAAMGDTARPDFVAASCRSTFSSNQHAPTPRTRLFRIMILFYPSLFSLGCIDCTKVPVFHARPSLYFSTKYLVVLLGCGRQSQVAMTGLLKFFQGRACVTLYHSVIYMYQVFTYTFSCLFQLVGRCREGRSSSKVHQPLFGVAIGAKK